MGKSLQKNISYDIKHINFFFIYINIASKEFIHIVFRLKSSTIITAECDDGERIHRHPPENAISLFAQFWWVLFFYFIPCVITPYKQKTGSELPVL